MVKTSVTKHVDEGFATYMRFYKCEQNLLGSRALWTTRTVESRLFREVKVQKDGESESKQVSFDWLEEAKIEGGDMLMCLHEENKGSGMFLALERPFYQAGDSCDFMSVDRSNPLQKAHSIQEIVMLDRNNGNRDMIPVPEETTLRVTWADHALGSRVQDIVCKNRPDKEGTATKEMRKTITRSISTRESVDNDGTNTDTTDSQGSCCECSCCCVTLFLILALALIGGVGGFWFWKKSQVADDDDDEAAFAAAGADSDSDASDSGSIAGASRYNNTVDQGTATSIL